MQRYARPLLALHWVIAILIVVGFSLGSFMVDMKFSPAKLQYFSWHKWIGVTIFGLVVLRLIVRLITVTPPYPASIHTWEKKLAHLTHVFLYLLMFAVPLSGYLYSSAAGIPVVYFGMIQLPTFIAPDPALKAQLKDVHEILTTIILIVVGLHVAAALKHFFWDKDTILQRMLPIKRTISKE